MKNLQFAKERYEKRILELESEIYQKTKHVGKRSVLASFEAIEDKIEDIKTNLDAQLNANADIYHSEQLAISKKYVASISKVANPSVKAKESATKKSHVDASDSSVKCMIKNTRVYNSAIRKLSQLKV
jgi:hypothetical protein